MTPAGTYDRIRDSIVANLLDGDVAGTITMRADDLADEAATAAMYALGFELNDDDQWVSS